MQWNREYVSLTRAHRPSTLLKSSLRLLCVLCLLFAASACATAKKEPPPSPIVQIPNAALMTPLPPPGPKPLSQAPSGSLWSEASGSLMQDIKAHKVGDILTITVSEESKASKTATTQTSKDKSLSGQFDFAGVSSNGRAPVGAASLGPWSGKFTNGFNGSGVTAKTDSMTTYMTATVVGVVPNGNLIIRGSRWTQVNNEMQQIVLEGVVRQADITRNNTILSQSIAEAKIFFVGKGPLSQHQKPGWGLQLLDMVSPF